MVVADVSPPPAKGVVATKKDVLPPSRAARGKKRRPFWRPPHKSLFFFKALILLRLS